MICDYKQKFKNDFGKLIKSLEGQSAEQIRSAALDYLKAAKQNAQDAGYSSINDFLSDWAKFVDWRLSKAGIEPNPKINNGSNIILNNNPIVLIINGVLLSPDPLNIAVKTGLIK